MARTGGGTVVLTGSAASQRGSTAFGAYALSKAALSHLAMSLAAEYGSGNVRVNCIAPAVVRTDFSRDLWNDEERHRTLVEGYPLGRIGQPEEIAAMALALCGRAGAWMTGQTLVIDGGQMAAVGCRFGRAAA
jgi:NAD(P)-dependent dehydrogenase (short-subunit alcohol dehydrogenase family)